MKHPKNTLADLRITLRTCNAVSMLAAEAIPQPEICRVLDISAKTQRKHYRKQLDIGASKLEGALARS